MDSEPAPADDAPLATVHVLRPPPPPESPAEIVTVTVGVDLVDIPLWQIQLIHAASTAASEADHSCGDQTSALPVHPDRRHTGARYTDDEINCDACYWFALLQQVPTATRAATCRAIMDGCPAYPERADTL